MTQGDAAGSCVNGCRQYVVQLREPQHRQRDGVVLLQQRRPHRQRCPYTVNFDGNGSKQLGCYVGRDGQDVWVDIHGWGGDVDTEKRFWARP